MKPEAKTTLLCRMVMITILVSLIFRGFLHALPHDFLKPVMYSLYLEMVYRAYLFFHLPDVIVVSRAGAAIFSICLITVSFLCILFPRERLVLILFSLLYFLYFLSYNTFTITHPHPMTMMVWITVPFWARKPQNRLWLWEAMRYYVCFIYTVSFVYKLMGGSFFFWNNGVNSVKWNQAKYLLYYPDTFVSHVLEAFISRPVLLNIGNIVVYLLEGAMITGFFTKKYDRWLLWIPVCIHLSTYLFSDVLFAEMLVVVFLFLDDRQLLGIQTKVPLLAR